MHRLLTINPGSTSTKIALFDDEELCWNETIPYSIEKLEQFEKVTDQLSMRQADIEELIDQHDLDLSQISAVIGRGGPFRPLEGGTYLIDKNVLNDIENGNVQAEHISNIGAILAYSLAKKADLPAYFVDPVSVDEFSELARICGLPELERKSLVHALNVKATAHKAANSLGKALQSLNFVIAHLGGGISICAMEKGKIVDVNNANEGGPFSPERSGSLPVSSLVKLCYSGKYSYAEMKNRIIGRAGLIAWLGTNDSIAVEKMIEAGDEKARLIYEAMAYQIAKEIGSMASVLSGEVDAVLITGGLAKSGILVEWIRERISYVADVMVFPGENELEALAMGALRVLRGEEEAKRY